MSSSNDEKKTSSQWKVKLDRDKCSMCEVCARKCPTGALHLERENDMLGIYFKYEECIGCTDENGCRALCPEDAIELEELKSTTDVNADVLLNESKLVQCSYCKNYFAPETKISRIKKKKLAHEVIEDYCPLCRRTNIVVRFIDEKRLPKGKAAYRSANDIMRKLEQEKKGIK